MKISENGLKLVKEFEGCLKSVGNGRYTTYICPAGVLTIGWGHTNDGGRPFKSGEVWTQAECDKALADDMGRFERMVERRVKVPLTQNQFDALVSFTYNCGEGNLAKSTLLRLLNAGDYEGAANQFAAWNKGGGRVLNGLTRRRAAEAKLFHSTKVAPRADVPHEDVPIAPVPQPAPAPPQDPMPQQVDPPKEDKPSIFERLWTWLAAGPIGGALAYLTDWRVVTVIVVALFAAAALIIWFFGPENVRTWVRQKVNR